jgi:3'-phosphoadenosine 5'-phosphosulfate sulfotransferase (PAPS reductase)/FAD synthetase
MLLISYMNKRSIYLANLEAEAITIIREVVAEFKNPVMLCSFGKDSASLIRLAQKAFYPGKILFFLMNYREKSLTSFGLMVPMTTLQFPGISAMPTI